MTTPATTTLLDAVNTCLAAVGEAPVNSTTSSELLSVVLAVQYINEVSRALQSMAWTFNSDYDYPFARNVDNKIPVGDNVLRIDTTAQFSAYDVVYRAGFLYDRAKKQYTFDRDLQCDVVWLFDFADLPEAAKWFITVAAARKLQARNLGSEARERFTKLDVESAWNTLKDAEGEVADENMFRDSWSVSSTLIRSPDAGSLFPLMY